MISSVRFHLGFHRPYWIDDLLCAVIFMVLLNFLLLILIGCARLSAGQATFVAFLLAGSVSVLGVLSKRGAAPAEFVTKLRLSGAGRLGETVGTGLACSLPAVAAALLFSVLIPAIVAVPASTHGTLPLWRIAMVVAIAPFWEEIIFRGLIFCDMRRYFGSTVAIIGSALTFAVMHPTVGIVPIFVLGICTARSLELTRSLLAPMIVHAIYNAAVLWIQYAH